MIAKTMTEWNAIRLQVLQRDGNRCRKCESDIRLDIHHIKPRKAGGTDELDNLITLCKKCHQRSETSRKTESGRTNITKTDYGFIVGPSKIRGGHRFTKHQVVTIPEFAAIFLHVENGGKLNWIIDLTKGITVTVKKVEESQ